MQRGFPQKRTSHYASCCASSLTKEGKMLSAGAVQNWDGCRKCETQKKCAGCGSFSIEQRRHVRCRKSLAGKPGLMAEFDSRSEILPGSGANSLRHIHDRWER